MLAVDAKTLFEVAQQLGPDFAIDDQGTFEMVTGTMHYHLRVLTIAFEIELFMLSSDPHDQARFGRRRRVFSSQIGCEIIGCDHHEATLGKDRQAWQGLGGRAGRDRRTGR